MITIYHGIEITAERNLFTDRWRIRYALPGQGETCTGYFLATGPDALAYARACIRRAESLSWVATESEAL